MKIVKPLSSSVSVAIFLVSLPLFSIPTHQAYAQEVIFCTTNQVISMEAENYSENEGYTTVSNDSASGGIGMQAGDTGTLSFDINLDSGDRWYLWIRTLAPDHTSNGMFLDFDNQRLSAPSDHQYAGESVVYLYKSATQWFWTPEWQAPGEGFHAGPIAIDTTAGEHRLSIVKRSIEDPLIDKIVLTKVNEAPTDLGPEETLCSDPPSPEPETACQQADINDDQVVNLNDFTLLSQNFLKTGTDVIGDINADEVVNLTDFTILATNFLKTCN